MYTTKSMVCEKKLILIQREEVHDFSLLSTTLDKISIAKYIYITFLPSLCCIAKN